MILYRGWVLLAALVCAGLFTTVVAQEERPQIIPGERKVPRKKDAGPRAVGVLRLAANGKASLVPIAIQINGKFWDAGAYKADPVPMALESGTVYEAERAGNSLGLFTVGSALHSNAPNVQAPWLGTGAWRPAGTEPAKKEVTAESKPVGIDAVDEPPRLSRSGSTAENKTPATNPAPASGSSQSPPSSKSGGKPDSDEDRPRLSKPASSEPPASTPSGSQPSAGPPSPGAPSSQGDSKPKQDKAVDKVNDRAQVPASDSGAGEANRPRLRRGKPAESFADESVPGYSKPGAAPVPTAIEAKGEDNAADSSVQLIPAISDAAGPEPRSYAFEWLKGEEDDRRKQVVTMAKEQLRAYIAAHAPATHTTAKTAPKSAHSMSALHGGASKMEEPILENVRMVAYDLWNSNQPVIVFNAEAHMPPPPAGTAHSDVDSELHYSVTLVTYPDIYNNLHKLYAGVTDKFHLDVTPRLELIDAVDADGDGRGELLFRETSDAGTGWVIYRATADKLWKMFDSLGAE